MISQTKYLFFLLFFTAFYSFTVAQNWSQIGSSKIYFSNLITADKDNWADYTYEYFKKDSNLVIVHKAWANELKDLFNDYPASFDSILEKAQVKEYQDIKKVDHYEPTLKNFTFKQAVIIIGRNFIPGYKEFIWQWKITKWYSQGNPCLINIVFQKEKEANKRLLKFLAVIPGFCEL